MVEDFKEVTVVITSCQRHDLLERTLRSFAQHNTHPISELIIVEDSEASVPMDALSDIFTDMPWHPTVSNPAGIPNYKVICNGKRKGQIWSIDRAYAEIRTPYIFHCEDDWEFTRPGFIEESLVVLDSSPNISLVSLRHDFEHPIIPGETYDTLELNWRGGWGSFSFNPGLRRLSDYRSIGSYGRHVGYHPGQVNELHISNMYRELSYKIASLKKPAVKHIGWDSHVDFSKLPSPPKVLIAIPVCHRYQVANVGWENTVKHRTDVGEQIASCRETWVRDLKVYAPYVDYRFFYGRGATREPLADEVFLDVPDDYKGLTQKVRGVYKWALEHGYDYVFKCDDDTYVWVDRLLQSDFDKHDYTGYANNIECGEESRYASGLGYWLSAKALKVLVEEPDTNDCAEDRWVGKTLYNSKIKVFHDGRYRHNIDKKYFIDKETVNKPHGFIAVHACPPDMIRYLDTRQIGVFSTALSRDFQRWLPIDTEESTLEREVEELMRSIKL